MCFNGSIWYFRDLTQGFFLYAASYSLWRLLFSNRYKIHFAFSVQLVLVYLHCLVLLKGILKIYVDYFATTCCNLKQMF